jgi:hypothetical protein
LTEVTAWVTVLWHILSYWRSDRDLLAADVDAGAPPTWDDSDLN